MDISNDTPLDAKYKVSGGGAPVGPHGRHVPSEDTSGWPVIPANTKVNLSVTEQGPWRVHFVINDEEFIVDARADNDFIHLAPSGTTFRAEVRRMAHATHA
ncbi:MAG: hypothetical protein WAM82_17120 [Thermoanaerobaculia bacterium]